MSNQMRTTNNLWLKFPEDLAWDIFTLDCMLVVLSAMFVAGLASFSAEFSQMVADHERWLWVSGATLAIIAVISLMRALWPSERIGPRTWWG